MLSIFVASAASGAMVAAIAAALCGVGRGQGESGVGVLVRYVGLGFVGAVAGLAAAFPTFLLWLFALGEDRGAAASQPEMSWWLMLAPPAGLGAVLGLGAALFRGRLHGRRLLAYPVAGAVLAGVYIGLTYTLSGVLFSAGIGR